MKTFKQFITELDAKNSIERLHPYKTMKMGGVKDGKFVYPAFLRLFKKVQAKSKSKAVWYQLKGIKICFVIQKQVRF